jgi:hypothetical protein
MAGNTDQTIDCEPSTSSAHRGLEPELITLEHFNPVRIYDQAEAKVLEALEAMMPSLEPLVRAHTGKVRTRKLEELIEIITENLVAPSNIDVSMARRLAARRARLLKEFGWTTAEELATANGSQAENRHALADNWKKRHQVFSVPHRDAKEGLREVFPLFQFEDHRPIKVVREIIEAFGERKSPWKLALWFTSNNGWLPNQARPVDLLTTSPNDVIEAARRDAGGSAA